MQRLSQRKLSRGTQRMCCIRVQVFALRQVISFWVAQGLVGLSTLSTIFAHCVPLPHPGAPAIMTFAALHAACRAPACTYACFSWMHLAQCCGVATP